MDHYKTCFFFFNILIFNLFYLCYLFSFFILLPLKTEYKLSSHLFSGLEQLSFFYIFLPLQFISGIFTYTTNIYCGINFFMI